MLKVWRNLRKKLIDQGNLRKYLLYAIGEILLVMIGILLALQVNNWNTQNSAKKEEAQYLRALQDEFQNNLDEINRNLELTDHIQKACIEIINFPINGPDFNELKLAAANRNAFRFPPKFLQSPGVLADLTSTGNLSKLSNQELRVLIQNWYSILEEVEEEEAELWIHRTDAIEYLMHNSSFRQFMIELDDELLGEIKNRDEFKMNLQKMHQDQYFDNLNVMYAILNTSLKIQVYPKLKSNIEAILKEIKEDLES